MLEKVTFKSCFNEMSNSKFFILLFISFVSSFNTSSSSNNYKCSAEQSHILILFKQSLSSINFSITDSTCRDELGSNYNPMMANWNTSIDCCYWNGVTCNHSTGDVIGVELGCGMLQGTSHSIIMLFNLPHLKILRLPANDFSGSQLPTYLNISSSLKVLDLRYIGLQGKLPDNIFNLQYLETLYLSQNYELTSPLPKVYTSTSIPLKSLDLSSTNVSGEIFNSIGHLKFLNELDLSNTNLLGEIPDSIGHLKSLNILILSNCSLEGSLPRSLANLTHLFSLHLSNNMLSGKVPYELFSLLSLEVLSLDDNLFDDHIDMLDQSPVLQTFQQLTNLTSLDLSLNNFRGDWELATLLSSLTNLEKLLLSSSGFSIIADNATHYVHPNLKILSLASCKLKVFPESLRAMTNLEQLDLSSNNIHGQIPDWAGEIGGNHLLWLDLSDNSITGLMQFQWDGLRFFYLVSNMIQGPFPPSICNMRNLQYLDMSYNSFDGVIPQCLINISSSLVSLNVKSNMLKGQFPTSICNMNQLEYLDMSDNSFDGVIPHCLVNITSSLVSIDLRNNSFRGSIPNIYQDCGGLEGIILNGNQLEGEVPSSLSKCQSLKILDLGNNQLNSTFPSWLGDLPNLQVLVLKSNKFHSPIVTSSTVEFPFPSLRVLDLSHNGFVGQLPQKYFLNFNAMKNIAERSNEPVYLNTSGWHYSIIIVVKEVEFRIPQLLVDYTIVDLSDNSFQREIPDVIGDLKSLKVLNLSHNSFIGRIPDALGKLLEIESLDLSWNQLAGEIPPSIADINRLAVLNLSKNHLVGHIPQGNQFNTFTEYSFGGNSGLCGFPLPKHCEHPQLKGDKDEEESGFPWKAVVMGYGCGTLIGMLMGYLMLSTGTPKWFNTISDEAEHMFLKRRKKRS